MDRLVRSSKGRSWLLWVSRRRGDPTAIPCHSPVSGLGMHVWDICDSPARLWTTQPRGILICLLINFYWEEGQFGKEENEDVSCVKIYLLVRVSSKPQPQAIADGEASASLISRQGASHVGEPRRMRTREKPTHIQEGGKRTNSQRETAPCFAPEHFCDGGLQAFLGWTPPPSSQAVSCCSRGWKDHVTRVHKYELSSRNQTASGSWEQGRGREGQTALLLPLHVGI